MPTAARVILGILALLLAFTVSAPEIDYESSAHDAPTAIVRMI